jgi:hypothetical protein
VLLVTRRVCIHVGLPKTGTTYLQETLWLSQERLAEHGVLVPGANHQFQRFAFWDLMGRRLKGVDQTVVPGKWHELVAAARQWSGRQVLLSDEFLANARPAIVRRIVRAFEPAEVHVVVTVRDLGRVMGSMWQQNVASGHTWSWSEFVAAVRDPEEGPVTASFAFWLRHDLKAVLSAWQSAVPPERIHIVVVPPADATATRLLELFARAADLDVNTLTPAAKRANLSIGATEAALLRRLNLSLEGRLNERQYQYMINRVVRPALGENTAGSRIQLPESQRDWVMERSDEVIKLLENGPYDIVGELDDLRPVLDGAAVADPDNVSDRDLANSAVAVLSAAVEYHAQYWWRTRRGGKQAAAGRRERLASASRAFGFRVKAQALAGADRNPILAKAARWYLRYARRDV